MNTSEWLVVLTGLAAIAWIHWYFYLAPSSSVRAANEEGGQRAAIVVRGGYRPSEVRARVGRPLRLEFDRQEDSPCSEEIVLPDLGIRRILPPHRATAIEFVPERPGAYEFTCGTCAEHGCRDCACGRPRREGSETLR